MRFTLGPTPFQPPPHPAPPQPPVAPADDAQPIFDEPDPVVTTAPASPPRTERPVVEARHAPPRGGLLALLGVALLFGGLVLAVIFATQMRRSGSDDTASNGEAGGSARPKGGGPEVVYASQSGKYRLSNAEKIWEKPLADPKDEDDNGDLLLRGTFRRPGQSRLNLNSTAKLVVMVLDKSGDVDEATRYVRKRYDREGDKDIAPTDFTEITGEPLGEPPPGDGPANSPTKRLKVRPGGANADPASEKLVVYAALKVGEDVIVAEGSCSWSDRETWERRLIQLVGSLRP
jgi:hypothetical protein